MRKILILMNFAVLILLISSCEDILNPHNETHHTKIKYHVVLKDQEHSVIMPLKVGNYWKYKVTKVDKAGNIQNAGTCETKVLRDTLMNGYKWFFVDDPMYAMGGYLYTNTDVGLWSHSNCKCGELRAQYPLLFSSYLLSNERYEGTFFDSAGKMVSGFYDFLVWIKVNKISDYSTKYGLYDCYRYFLSAEAQVVGETKTTSYNIIVIEYFVPNLGLVRKEQGYLEKDGSLKISEIWELISTNVKI